MVEQAYELVEMQKPSIWQRHVCKPYTLGVAEVGFLTIQIKAAEEITSASRISQFQSCKIQHLIENMVCVQADRRWLRYFRWIQSTRIAGRLEEHELVHSDKSYTETSFTRNGQQVPQGQ